MNPASLRSSAARRRALLLVVPLLLAACGGSGGRDDAGIDAKNPFVDGSFVCFNADSQACRDGIHYTCVPDGEFLTSEEDNCRERDRICVEGLGCAVCRPDEITCRDNNVVECDPDGQGFDVVEECAREEGFVCRDGMCQNLCEVARDEVSYVGCEFWAADLDNAAIAAGRDASSQQYALVVSNPGRLQTDVFVEVNDAARGEEPSIREVDSTTLLPGDLQVFELPRREVDGSSSNRSCTPADRTCPRSEVCRCAEMDTETPCFCRNSEDAEPKAGLNDGTHTAISSQAYRIRSQLPIIAYQFNPLDNVGVFSNDASLLLPTSAIGGRYTVVSWPQTIADGPDGTNRDFDPRTDDEDLRSFLTIVGTVPGTQVDLTMGPDVVKVVGAGEVPVMGGGEELSLEIGPFDVINLETEGLNADFTSTLIDASQPVTVFVGSEASDAPRFDTYMTRQCCADHLEEQLFPDVALGSSFIIARMPPRSTALNDAFITDTSVGEVNEPEWVRVVAIGDGETVVNTTKPPPDDQFTLSQRENVIITADQDFEMWTDSAKPVAVLQTLPSQQAIGIPSDLPGGDPAIIAVPPEQQWRQDYVFLTPDKYAFDFVVISAQRGTQIMLDGSHLSEMDCTTSPADGIERTMDDPPPDKVIHRCQLSFPDVRGPPNVEIMDGVQRDGVHTLVADDPVGVVVYGFDAFVSYGYGGGLNLKPIPR